MCCGVVLVLVSPGLDPGYSPAVAAQEALVRGVLKRFCRARSSGRGGHHGDGTSYSRWSTRPVVTLRLPYPGGLPHRLGAA